MRTRRTLSALLALALLLGCMGWTPTRAEEATLETNSGTVTENIQALDSAEKTDILQQEAARGKEHIARLHNEEGLNQHIYLNRDGSKTMYLYDHPVKYLDTDGAVQDISLEIAQTEDTRYPYRTKANSAVTSFPADMADGIRLEGAGVSIRLAAQMPVSSGKNPLNRNARQINGEKVAYTYDAKTSIEYSLTYAGFKEDIVVSQYTGQTEYQFTLYTNGLTLTELGGSYYLTDAEGEIRASIGEIIVFTADEKNNTMGELVATTVEENQVYNMTIVLDGDYLADPNTTYPIRIDPTVNLTYAEAGADALEDVVIQSNNTPLPQYTASVIGKSSKGISRLLVRFPGIDFAALEGVTVTSAYLSIRDLLCEAESMTLTCYPFTGAAWTETTANWSMTQSWGAALDSKNISYANGRLQEESHRYNFDISALVQQWVDGTVNDDLGVILRADNSVEQSSENFYKTFGSYERSSNKTYFVLTYDAEIKFGSSEVDVDEGQRIQLTPVTTLENATWVWHSANDNIATVNENGMVTGVCLGQTTITAYCEELEKSATCVVYVTIPDGVYYIENQKTETYIHVPNGTISQQISIALHDFYEPSLYGETTLIRQMWKIKYISSGSYSIRAMLNPRMGLYTDSSNSVVLKDIGTSDLQLLFDLARWKISRNSTGFDISNAYYSKDSNRNPIFLQANNGIIELDSKQPDGGYIWGLEKIANPPTGTWLLNTNSGEIIVETPIIYITKDEMWTTARLNAMEVSYSPESIDQTLLWTSRNENVATVNSSGKITGLSEGNTIIKGTNAVTGKWISIMVYVLPVANGTYVIKNKENHCFVHMNNYSSGDDYYEVHQAPYGEISCKSWKITHLGDGYYSIQSAMIPSHYLGVLDDSSALNAEIGSVETGGVLSAGTKWKIETTSSGALKFIPQTGMSSDYVLAVSTYSEESEAPLIQGAYVPNYSYKDEWLIAEAAAFRSTRFENTTISIQLSDDPLTMSDEWYPLIVAAVDSWNNANIGITIHLTTETAPVVLAVTDMYPHEFDSRLTEETLGVTHCDTHVEGHPEFMLEAEIFIFSIKHDGYGSNMKQGTIAHEIAHLFGLNDNPGGVDINRSIMNYDADGERYFTPQEFDLFNVKFIMNLD